MFEKEKIKANIYRGLSYLYQILGKNEKAIHYMDRNICKSSSVKESDWWTLGYLYTKMNQWAKAFTPFLKAIKVSNGNPKYIYWLGRAAEENGNKQSAENLYDKAISKDVKMWEAIAAKAQIKMNEEKYNEALSLYLECLKVKPLDTSILNSTGLCYLHLNDPKSARSLLEKALRLKPYEYTIRFNYAMVIMRLGYFKEALEEYKKLDGLNSADVLSAMGYCFCGLQDYENSINYYKKALVLDPDNNDILINIAAVYAKSGEGNLALGILRELLTREPRDPYLLNNTAWIFETLQEYKKAEGHYYRGLAVSGGDPRIAYNLVCCLKKQHKYVEALDIIEHMKIAVGWKRTAWASMAQIYEDMGADKLAVTCYNKALGLD